MNRKPGSAKNAICRLFNRKAESLLTVELDTEVRLFDIALGREIKVRAWESFAVPLAPDARDSSVLTAINGFIKKNNLQQRNTILILRLPTLIIKRVQLPVVPDKELPDAIKWHFKDEVPFDAADLVLDFSVIKKTAKSDGSEVLDIICALAREEEIKSGIRLLVQAGLTCVAVALTPFGYPVFVDTCLPQEKNKTFAVLHIGAHSSFIIISKAGKLEFYRDLPFSVDRLKAALKNVLVFQGGRMELTPQEIEEVLHTFGISQDSTLYKNKISLQQVFSMLRPDLERLLEEIKRSLHYYETTFEGDRIATLFVGGAGSALPHIDTFLAKNLSLDTAMLPLKELIKASPGIDLQTLAPHSAIIGTALDYAGGINLLPFEFRGHKIEKVQRVSLRWLVFLALLFLAVSYLFAKVGISGYQKRLDNSLVYVKVLAEVKQVKTRVDGFNAFISGVRSSESPFGGLLKKISAIAGQELFISDLSLDAEAKTGTMHGLVKSNTRNPDIILTEFISAMNSSGYCRDVTITSFEKSAQQDMQVTVFQVNFKIS